MIQRIRRPGQPPSDIDHGPREARPEGIRRMSGSVPTVGLPDAVPYKHLWDIGAGARAQHEAKVTRVAGRLPMEE